MKGVIIIFCTFVFVSSLHSFDDIEPEEDYHTSEELGKGIKKMVKIDKILNAEREKKLEWCRRILGFRKKRYNHENDENNYKQ